MGQKLTIQDYDADLDLYRVKLETEGAAVYSQIGRALLYALVDIDWSVVLPRHMKGRTFTTGDIAWEFGDDMSESYNFNKKTQSGHYEVQVDTESQYGYFEHDELGDESGGGLWFEQSAEKDTDGNFKLELMDYDGVSELPKSVIKALREMGFIVGENFE